MKEEEILRQQPFRNIMGRIIDAISLQKKGAISGETFKVISKTGKSYKLRYCTGLLKARKIERNVKLFPKAFPLFYGREGRYLLFDWIEGKSLGKEVSLDSCYQIGKLAGEIHAKEELDSTQDIDQFFNRILANISKSEIFDKETLAKIELKYKKMKKGLKIDLVLELDDLHPGNMILDDKGKVYYVDEEGFTHRIKGLGLAKPFLTREWMKSKEQQEAFWKGYHEHHSSDYFDLDYQRFVAFLQYLRAISTRIKTGEDYLQEKEIILKMIQ
ncbi:hypothetical protein J4444_05055 [Candidatus Woesearchaeota archaeon]|nr:hypothetical protein [Candidatus Woesearchaeota archaeon]